MDPEQEKLRVLKDLELLIPHIHRIVEASVGEAIQYFEDRPIEYQTLPDLVRDKVKYYLKQHPQTNVQYELEELTRNGISLFCMGQYYERYHIKILHSHDGELPPIESMSSTKRKFLCQQLPLPGPFKDLVGLARDASRKTLKLVFLWKVKIANGIGILDLKLVRPGEGKNKRPVIYWHQIIKDPTLTIEMQATLTYPDDVDDLGISLPDVDETGNGQMG